MTHVLIVSSEPYKIPSVPLGGIFQEHQGKALAALGLRVGVASGGLMPLRSALEALPPKDELDGSIPVSRIFARSFLPLRFRHPARLDEEQIDLLCSAISRHTQTRGRPDIIHAHNLQYAALAAHRCAAELGVPFCITEHSSAFLLGSTPPSLHAAFREAVEASKGIACVSASLSRAVQGLLRHCKDPVTIPNILDPQLEAAARAYEPSINGDGPFRFLAIGRLDHNKNHALLLRAFAQGLPAPARAELEIAGEGVERHALQQLAVDLGISSRVRFLGLQDRPGIFDALRRSDALVQTSTVETFGVSIIEALAFGLPVLTTPSGGPSDIVLSGFNGEVLPDHEVSSLASAMARTARDIDAFDRRNIQRHALDTYDASSFQRRIGAWYASMGITKLEA